MGVKQTIALFLVAGTLLLLLTGLAGCTGSVVNEKAVGAASVETGESADQPNQTTAQTIVGAGFGISNLTRQNEP